MRIGALGVDVIPLYGNQHYQCPVCSEYRTRLPAPMGTGLSTNVSQLPSGRHSGKVGTRSTLDEALSVPRRRWCQRTLGSDAQLCPGHIYHPLRCLEALARGRHTHHICHHAIATDSRKQKCVRLLPPMHTVKYTKTWSHHNTNCVITCDTECYHNNNFRCYQLRLRWDHGDSRFSVFA